MARSVNTTQVIANWLIGREIIEEEQKGVWRAEYGKSVLNELSRRLTKEYGNGYSVDNLELFRRFYREYPRLISDALPRKSGGTGKSDAVRRISPPEEAIQKSGQLAPNLSWTHYRVLLRLDKPAARTFYEIESLKNNWSARELERQVNSLWYERLALKQGQKRIDAPGHQRAGGAETRRCF